MPILVTDFDGTFTRRDFFDLILERHDPPGARALWDSFLAGGMTPFEGIAGVLGSLRTDEAGASALVAAMEPPPGAAEAVQALQAAGWEIVVASAGCRWYIDRVLDSLGLSFAVQANPGWFAPERGVVMELDPGSPYFHPRTGHRQAGRGARSAGPRPGRGVRRRQPADRWAGRHAGRAGPALRHRIAGAAPGGRRHAVPGVLRLDRDCRPASGLGPASVDGRAGAKENPGGPGFSTSWTGSASCRACCVVSVAQLPGDSSRGPSCIVQPAGSAGRVVARVWTRERPTTATSLYKVIFIIPQEPRCQT
ncbi:MAG: haloacid dehalogenase-like hydrolase [bacterium]|nr:haloacid dehalogenase-like hydrolase [bacterium]